MWLHLSSVLMRIITQKKEKKKCKQKEKFSKVLCAKKFKQAGELENNQYQNNCKFCAFFWRNSSKVTHFNKNWYKLQPKLIFAHILPFFSCATDKLFYRFKFCCCCIVVCILYRLTVHLVFKQTKRLSKQWSHIIQSNKIQYDCFFFASVPNILNTLILLGGIAFIMYIYLFMGNRCRCCCC